MTAFSAPAKPAPGCFSARDLACRRGGRLVFARLGFEIGPGGALLLRGPNGSGKSTLLRCLAGLLRPEAGAVLWDGTRIGEDPEAHRRRLRYLGHQDGVKPQLSVLENLSFGAALAGQPRPHAVAALEAFGIERLADLPTRYLSAGQRRRLALARLVAAPAPLWLLDEPLAGLDAAAVGLFTTAVAAHRRSGGMVALSVHGAFALPDAQVLELGGFAAAGSEPEPAAP